MRAPLLLAGVLLVACSTSGTGSGGATGSTGTGSAGSTRSPGTTNAGSVPGATTLAGTFVFGSGAECPDEPYCLPGLRDTYGLEFRSFEVRDSGGPLTRDALTRNEVQVGVLFTTDPHISSDGFVLLEDDKHLQPAENVTPIINDALVAGHGPDLAATLDQVSAGLTTAQLTELNRQVDIAGTSTAAAASAFLDQIGLTKTSAPTRTGPIIVVGSANFSESTTIGEIYAQALTRAGFPVDRRLGIGNRATYFPLVRSGEVGLMPEYVGSLLGYLDEDATESSDSAEAHAALEAALSGSGLSALAAAPGEDKNGIAVTRQTAQDHGLTKVSDLAKRP